MLADSEQLSIVVLAGGSSSEREVSLQSGKNVAAALQEASHVVDVLDPAEFTIDDEDNVNTFLTALRRYDVILPMLHGTGGEDGTLQRWLNRSGVPWIGSSPEASALTFDKVATRRRLMENGLPVPAGVTLTKQARVDVVDALRAGRQHLMFPVVVKPASQGSSVGISIVQAIDHFVPALRLAWQYGDHALVESFIPGREITVPWINGQLLPAVEIIPSQDWYNYHAKYTDDATKYLVDPPDLSPEVLEVARRACEVCDVAGICRVDLRVTEEGQPFILEINTIPGMTSHSLVPMSAAAAGMSLGQLCEHVCRNPNHGLRSGL
ncbi:MAG: D-alanine--D-alanine ligase [Planctomycetaceae bacterium]|nr:D-alanine--D-alanine ligase [Planctomycetaceae bacterium]